MVEKTMNSTITKKEDKPEIISIVKMEPSSYYTDTNCIFYPPNTTTMSASDLRRPNPYRRSLNKYKPPISQDNNSNVDVDVYQILKNMRKIANNSTIYHHLTNSYNNNDHIYILSDIINQSKSTDDIFVLIPENDTLINYKKIKHDKCSCSYITRCFDTTQYANIDKHIVIKLTNFKTDEKYDVFYKTYGNEIFKKFIIFDQLIDNILILDMEKYNNYKNMKHILELHIDDSIKRYCDPYYPKKFDFESSIKISK